MSSDNEIWPGVVQENLGIVAHIALHIIVHSPNLCHWSSFEKKVQHSQSFALHLDKVDYKLLYMYLSCKDVTYNNVKVTNNDNKY